MIPPGYILIRPETLAGVQKAVEAALGPAAAECVAAGGRAGGARAAAAVGGTGEERVERLLAQGAAIGWGHFRLERLTPTSLSVSVADSVHRRGVVLLGIHGQIVVREFLQRVADNRAGSFAHACGPGKTAQFLRSQSLRPLVFPSSEEWKRWLNPKA